MSGYRLESQLEKKKVPITSDPFFPHLGLPWESIGRRRPPGRAVEAQSCCHWCTESVFTVLNTVAGFFPKVCSTEHWFPGMGFGKLPTPSPSQRVPMAFRVFEALISPVAKRLF